MWNRYIVCSVPPSLLANSHGVGSFSQQMTIEMLHGDILLDIFRHTLAAIPRFWPVLTWVCRRWRQIVLISPLGLNLRLYCTHGTPVLTSLDCWPPLPIIVEYGGISGLEPPAPEDDDNIVAALEESGRVRSIRLTVTSSLLEKIRSSAAEPYLELEELFILSGYNMQLTLPGTFRWGPLLHTLHSTRIAFLSLPQLLSPCHDLVDLQLHEIPSAGYFPPEAFADALSGMTHLQTLTLHLLSFPRRRSFLGLPPPERIVLPALTRLKYRGTSKYLDCLAARIDAPRLGNIDITFFSQPAMDATQFGRFVERVYIQTLLSEGEFQISANAISLSLFSLSTSTSLQLQISCKQLDWQLSCMAQVCDQISQFLICVKELRISTTRSSSGQESLDGVAGEQWLNLVRPFGRAGSLWVASGLTTDILCTLGLVDERNTIMLPSLRHLHVEDLMAIDEPSWDALLSFTTLRSRSGRPLQVNVPFSQCHRCHSSFRLQKNLDRHLVDRHAYRTMCSYCDDFECTTRNGNLFRKHLEGEHPILMRSDPFISNPTLNFYRLDQLVKRHSSLRAPDIASPSTTSTTPLPQ